MKKIQWYFNYLSPFENVEMNEQDKQKIIEKWKHDNGAADFNLKSEDIILFDGGLFSIENKKVMLPRFLRLIKIKNSQCRQVISSKKKYLQDEYRAIFWFSELDETIRYFQRMKKMLNKIGYKTDYQVKNV